MRKVKCPSCGGPTKRNGRTAAGTQRWMCLDCGLTFVIRLDNASKRLEEFLGWLLSKARFDHLGRFSTVESGEDSQPLG